jgi:hypothetical protein
MHIKGKLAPGVSAYELQLFFRRQGSRINAFIDEPFLQGVIPSPRDNLPALPVGPPEMFRQVYIILSKSYGRPWGHEVLVPIGNAQVVLRIKDIDLL